MYTFYTFNLNRGAHVQLLGKKLKQNKTKNRLFSPTVTPEAGK